MIFEFHHVLYLIPLVVILLRRELCVLRLFLYSICVLPCLCVLQISHCIYLTVEYEPIFVMTAVVQAVIMFVAQLLVLVLLLMMRKMLFLVRGARGQ